MKQFQRKYLGAMTGLLLLFAAGFALLSRAEPRFERPVLMGADGLMFLLCMLSFAIIRNNVNKRTLALRTGVTGGTTLKIFVWMVAVVTYAWLNRTHFYKPMLIPIFGIYIVYTAVETYLVFHLVKNGAESSHEQG